MVARGEVWWVEAEGEKRRPYLILTRDRAIPVLTQIIAVPTTRTTRNIPSEVRLDRQHGMPQACVLALDDLRIIRKSLLVERITRLDALTMHAVCEALAFATGCD